MAKYRTSEEQDLIDVTKQAKLIPGNNVHISDTNEISVDECKIGKSFTTNNSVLVIGATYEKTALDFSKVTASTVGLDVDDFTVTAKDVTVK